MRHNLYVTDRNGLYGADSRYLKYYACDTLILTFQDLFYGY